MKKVIFLDHDGVICLDHNFGSRLKKQKKWGGRKLSMTNREIPLQYRFDDFDKDAISTLNQILERTDADIVVSSDWRLYATLEELGEYYQQQGIIKKPIGFTKQFSTIHPKEWSRLRFRADLELERSIEIQHWLSEHPEVTHWVAVDDLNMSVDHLSDRFAATDDSASKLGLENFVLVWEGISQSGVKERVVDILLK
jgi:hypothetical protein